MPNVGEIWKLPVLPEQRKEGQAKANHCQGQESEKPLQAGSRTAGDSAGECGELLGYHHHPARSGVEMALLFGGIIITRRTFMSSTTIRMVSTMVFFVGLNTFAK